MSIITGLRSPAMNRTVAAVGAAVVLTAAASASAATVLSTHPHHRALVGSAAAASPLAQAITGLQPTTYWPMNDPSPTETDASGNSRPGLTVAGTGTKVTFKSATNPPGGAGGSAAFRPDGRQSGQYLRSSTAPVARGARGTVIVWFKLTRSLPGWWQTLLVDNGAATGYGAGFFISDTGRLAYTDSQATYDPLPGTFGAPRRTISGPLNDGRWHMLAFVDQYTQQGTGGWKPSLIYLDGRVVDRTIVGFMANTLGRDGQSRLLVGAGQRNQVSKLGRFSGNVADIALFERLLTTSEISSVWQAGN